MTCQYLRTLLVAVLLLSGCHGNNSDDAPGDDTDTDTDTHSDFVPEVGRNDHTLLVDGYEREVIIYASESALENGNAPVIFFFHGTNQTGELAYGIKDGKVMDPDSGWREKADAEGLIAVFPTALNYCYLTDTNGNGTFDDEEDEYMVAEKWSIKSLGDPAHLPLCDEDTRAQLSEADAARTDHPIVEDLNFVDAIIETVSEVYPVDAKRFFLSGFSNGGSFASRLTQEKSEAFVATFVSAGPNKETPAAASRAISHTGLLGSKDSRILALIQKENPDATEIPFSQTLPQDFPLLAEAFVAPMLTVLQLNASAPTVEETTINDAPVIIWTFSDSAVGAENTFRFVLTRQMGHVFPNGTNYPVIGANMAWDQFKDMSLP